jgi:hypothetical protein
MPGSDHILSKGLVLASNTATAVSLGQGLVIAPNTQVASPGQTAQVTLAATGASAGAVQLIGLAGENIDLVKIQTGKAFISVNIMGVAKAIADGAVVIGHYVGSSNTTAASLHDMGTGPAAAHFACGIALSGATTAGDIFDVLLTPGAVCT